MKEKDMTGDVYIMTTAEELKAEINELREKGRQFVAGEVSRGDFKALSGGRGVYAQKEKGKFMIRLRTSSGILSKEHLRCIVSYAEKYRLDQIHLTTRQAIQLHELAIDDVCDIMANAIDHGLFTRGGGGNFPRNVTLSPLAGVDPEEVFDVTPFALQAGRYFQERITTYQLPRKFKTAFSASAEDTGCAAINDIGFIAAAESGKPCFKLYLGGGLGGGPAVAVQYPQTIKPERMLYYIEAMINLFRGEGDYQNKARARTRFIVKRLGTEGFLECFDKYLEEAESTCHFEEISPQMITKDVWQPKLDISGLVIPQRQPGRYTFVLHPLCGQLSTADTRQLLEYVTGKDDVDLRLGMNQDIFVRNLTTTEVTELMELTKPYNRTDQIGRTVTCVGTPTCQIGIRQSQKLTRELVQAAAAAGLEDAPLPLIQVNGCLNSCSRHPVAALGLAGFVTKTGGQVTPCFRLFTGGSVSGKARLGQQRGTIAAERIPQFVAELAGAIKEQSVSYNDYCRTDQFEELVNRYLLHDN